MKSAQRAIRDQRVYRFDGFCLDPLERRLTFEEAVIAIPAKPLDALLALVENAATLMGKQDLHQHLWPDRFVEDVTLARTISDLRAFWHSTRILNTSGRCRNTVTGSLRRYIPFVPKSHNRRSAATLLKMPKQAISC